jgi:predicted nucleotidyltransferase
VRRDEALAILEKHTPQLKESFEVASVYLFGSTASDKAGKASDVDVLVVLRPEAQAGLFTLSRLKSHLENLFGCNVDLLTTGAIHPRLRQRIEGDAIRAG